MAGASYLRDLLLSVFAALTSSWVYNGGPSSRPVEGGVKPPHSKSGSDPAVPQPSLLIQPEAFRLLLVDLGVRLSVGDDRRDIGLGSVALEYSKQTFRPEVSKETAR